MTKPRVNAALYRNICATAPFQQFHYITTSDHLLTNDCIHTIDFVSVKECISYFLTLHKLIKINLKCTGV